MNVSDEHTASIFIPKDDYNIFLRNVGKSKKQSHNIGGAGGERMYSSYSFLTSALIGVSGQRYAPVTLYPRGKDPPVPTGQEAG
jgi:hypothetical protein